MGVSVLHAPHQPHDHDHDDDGNCGSRSDRDSTIQDLNETFSVFRNYGVQFRFPADWTLSEQTKEDETTITVESDGTSFWTLMLFDARPDPDSVLDTAVDAFKEVYDEIDVVSTITSVCGLPALGQDIDFVCYDLVNSAILRVFQTAERTVMVMYQGTDHELKSTRDLLETMTSSLQCDDE